MKTNHQHIIRIYCFAVIVISTFSCSNSRHIGSENTSADRASFLFLSDIHLNTYADTTTYGYDTGMELWARFLQKADSILGSSNSPQFIIYTGDLPAHYSCTPSCYLDSSNRTTHNQNLSVILSGLRNLANKYHKALFYMPGNNDGIAGDYYSFADEAQQTPFSLVPENKNPYPALNIHKDTSKTPCIVSMPNPTMGYYSARPIKGLRLICLNTVMYDKDFTTVDGTNKDVDRQTEMTWLSGQLAEATAMNEKIYIAMHIPPGTDAYSGKDMWDDHSTNWKNMFLSLTTQYSANITGIFYGHTHMDELRRLYDSTNTHITEVAISCPGVTPQHSNNPGFKTVSYNRSSKEVMDFTTYYTTPGGIGWGSNTYNFNTTFNNTTAASIYQCISGMSLTNVNAGMTTIFTVKNGPPGYNIQQGIEVMWGK
jgi:sphingomyelin phosphodiesterase acid-like 3